MEWDKIWAYNKKIIDDVSPRFTAIVKDSASTIVLTNGPDSVQVISTDMNPKKDLGKKATLQSKEILVESGDA